MPIPPLNPLAYLRSPITAHTDSRLIDAVFRKTQAFRCEQLAFKDYPRHVLDFGGGFGVHYRQFGYRTQRWAVVENIEIVRKAQTCDLESSNLRFFPNISEAMAWLGTCDLVYSNGALQYTHVPIAILIQLIAFGIPTIRWDRTELSFDSSTTDIERTWLSWHGPRTNVPITERRVLLPRTLIPCSTFLAAHSAYTARASSRTSFHFQLKASP
jgi:hypothetical protein